MPKIIPHFTLPFSYANAGSLGVVATTNNQDSDDDISACVEAVMRYAIGFRHEKPSFGIPDQAFVENGPDLDVIRAAILRWETRAGVTMTSTPDRFDNLVYHVLAQISKASEGSSA